MVPSRTLDGFHQVRFSARNYPACSLAIEDFRKGIRPGSIVLNNFQQNGHVSIPLLARELTESRSPFEADSPLNISGRACQPLCRIFIDQLGFVGI